MDAVAQGLAVIVGAGIYVGIGVAAGVAGPAIVLSILLAAVVASLTAAASARLGALYPLAGGTYEYASRLLSPMWGFIAGWTWLGKAAVLLGAVALSFGAYLQALVPVLPSRWVGVTVVLAVTGVNLLGTRLAGWVVDGLVIIKLAALLLFIGVGATAIRGEHFAPFAPTGLGGVLEGAALIFFAYVGFEQPSKLGEEIREPERTIPQATFLALGLSTALYGAVAMVAVGLIGAAGLAGSPAPLWLAVQATGVPWASAVTAGGALVATLSVLMGEEWAVSRMLFAMGRRAQLPRWLVDVNCRTGTPSKAVLIVGGVGALLTAFVDVRSLLEFASFVILCHYALTNTCAMRLAPARRCYPVGIALVGLLSSVGLALTRSPPAIVGGLVFLSVGAVYALLLGGTREIV